MLAISQSLFMSVLILSVFQMNYSESVEISSYARVSKNGDSISIQSDKGNKSIDQIPTKVSDIDSTLIDKHNRTREDETGEREAKQMNDKSLSEKSTGRAIQSNYYFPLPQILTKPARSNSYSSDKTGRLIVYPSYVSPNNIDRSQTRYNYKPPTGQQTAQRRFQYTPDSIYKFKGSDGPQGYKYSQPPTDMADSAPNPSPPASKFTAPIVVPDISSPPKPSYLPPSMMPSAPGSQFLPTALPEEPTSPSPVIDLLSFPPHVNSSYIPNELDAIKNSIDSNQHQPASEETTYTPAKNLHNFPPNIDSSYLPPNMMKLEKPINSYLPPPSADNPELSDTPPDDDVVSYTPPKDLYNFPPYMGYLPPGMTIGDKDPSSMDTSNSSNASSQDDQSMVYTPPKDLHSFPPNINSSYVPPNMSSNESPINSYLAPPSGDNPDVSNDMPTADKMPYTPPKDLHSFPPNIASSYLPPSMMKVQNPFNSYGPPPSGDNMAMVDVSKPSILYTPLKDLHNFPPNIESSYLPPNMIRSNNPVNSYLPPPSGDSLDNSNVPQPVASPTAYMPPKDLHNFPPNIDSSYLPPGMKSPEIPNNSYYAQPSGNEAEIPPPAPYMYVPPNNLHNFPPNIGSSYLPPGMKQVMSSVNSYLPPASGSVSGFDDGSKQNLAGPMPTQMSVPMNMPPQMSMPMNMPMDMSMNSQMDMSMDMQPPMDMPMDMPPMDDDDHHHHHHDHHDHSGPDFSQWLGSDIIYDDHHHHHHHETTTTTTEAPEEPRVKKYSYYYLGRKLWYIPLYFTLWFCLYVAALIIRSIGRHKVDLPNHYVARSLHDMTHQETVEKINQMTAFAMTQIEDFKEKYL